MDKVYKAKVKHVNKVMDFYIYGHSPCKKKIPENGSGYTYYMLPLDGNNKNVYRQIDNTTLQELFTLNDEQKKLLIQECKKKVESFKYSLLDLSGCLNDCLKWGDENFYTEAEENFNVCLRKLKEAKQIIEGIF